MFGQHGKETDGTCRYTPDVIVQEGNNKSKLHAKQSGKGASRDKDDATHVIDK